MTSYTTTMTDDPFAGGDKKPSVKFPTIGTTITAVVTDTPKLVQSKDYTTGEPAFWPAKPWPDPEPDDERRHRRRGRR